MHRLVTPGPLSGAFGRDALRSLSIVYIAVPNLIFLLGWLWWPYALACGTALCVAVARVIQAGPEGERPTRTHDWRLYAWIGVLFFAWLSMSGIGGFGYQNSDWRFRNSALRALIETPWPAAVSVGGSDRLLVSYIAYYLPAALVGKLGEFAIGRGWWLANVALWLWSLAGAGLALAWLMRLARNYSAVPVVLLIAFCGVDLLGWWLTLGKLPSAGDEIGIWGRLLKYQFLYPGFTAQLYWIPHQALAAWIVLPLILYDGIAQRTSRNLVLLGAITVLWSPFVTLGLIPYAAWVSVRSRWSGLVSVQNAIGLFVGGSVAVFLTSINAGELPHGLHRWWHESIANTPVTSYLAFYALFLLVGFGLYAFVVRQILVRSPEWESTLCSLFWTAVVCLTLIPSYRLGAANDFCMRVSIPSLLVLLILVSSALRPEKIAQTGRRAFVVALALLLFVGSASAASEVARGVMKIYAKPAIWPLGIPIVEVPEFGEEARRNGLLAAQYTAPLDTPFVRHLAPPLPRWSNREVTSPGPRTRGSPSRP